MFKETDVITTPDEYEKIIAETEQLEFTMGSDMLTGSFLKTLAAAKPGGNFLEIGTGTGLGTSWILAGMDQKSRLTSIEYDAGLSRTASGFFNDERVDFICSDGKAWVEQYKGPAFDFIFADAWLGSLSAYDTTVELLKIGGLCIMDDLAPASNWPKGHERRVDMLVNYICKNQSLQITLLNWSSGLLMATRVK